MKRARAVIAAIAGHTLLVLLFPTLAWSSDRVSLREPAEGAERRLTSLDELPKEAAFEEFVRFTYADLVRWTAPSGKDLSIQVENFLHFPKESFDTVHYTDVVTLPGGDTIVATRVRHRADWTDEVRVMYDPAWITRHPYLQTEEGEKAASLRLGEALEWGTPDDARLAQLTGITSFDVTVSLEDKSRTYRAAFGWIDRDPSSSSISNVEAIFWDHVTVGVGETLAETAPLGSEIPSPRPPTNEPEADGIRRITAESSTCTAGIAGSLNGFLLYQSDRTGHSSGSHIVTAQLDAVCDCTSSCGQTCEPRLRSQACPEDGTTDRCHVMSAPGIDAVSGSVSNTSTQGASDCGGGVACAWKACLGCWCGSLSVSISGIREAGGISFSASSPDGVTMKQQHVHTCNACPVECSSGSLSSGAVSAALCGPEKDDPTSDTTDSGDCGDYTTPCTPIVINLGSGRPRLSGLDDPVQFDLDDDPSLETVSWTERGSATAFLVLDRDGDGEISREHEFFGAFTPQPSSSEPNGFRALAVFDEKWLDGDEDGWITAADPVFPELMLWFDYDHNGVSEEHELFTLADYEIEAIELDYITTRSRDRFGNEFRWSSRVRFNGGRTTRAYDVILLSPSP